MPVLTGSQLYSPQDGEAQGGPCLDGFLQAADWARATSWAGVYWPSEAVEWVCKSACRCINQTSLSGFAATTRITGGSSLP